MDHMTPPATDTPEHAEFLRKFMSEFHGFIGRVYTVLPRNTA